MPTCPTNGSVFFSVGLGRTAFVRDTSYTSAMTKAGKAVYLSSATPKNIISESAFNQKSPLTGYRNFYLWYHEQSLTDASFEPSALVADPGANCERIQIDTAPRQILTIDYFADIQPLAAVRDDLPADIKSTSEIPVGAPGFVIRTWFAGDQTAKVNGLYGVPSGDPLGYVVFYRKAETSSPLALSKTLGIIHRVKSSSSNSKTQSWVHLNDEAGNWTSTHYKDLPSGNIVLRRTTRTVTSRTSANKYTLTQSDEEASLSAIGDLGSLVEVSNSEEEFDDIGGLKRLVRRTLGANLPAAQKRTSTYGWVNAPANTAVHGLPQWEYHPDGSFVHHTYNYSVGGTSGSIITRRPWKSTTWTPGATTPVDSGCIVETTSFTESSMTVTRKLNGSALISSEESVWTTQGSLNVYTHKVRYGANTTDVLTTTTAYNGPSDGDQANRIAWRIRQDGTAEIYSYEAVPNVPGNYTQTVEVGQGTSTGITQGRRTVSVRNGKGFVTQQNEYWFKTGSGATTVSLSNWLVANVPYGSGTLSSYDFLGRPQGKIHNGNSSDYEATIYGCCGLAYQRDRSGKVTEYFQDELHRQYKQIETTGSVVETTTTARASAAPLSGMVTETRRSSGGLNLLVKSSRVTTNGELELSQSPDANNDGVAEDTTYTYSYPGSGHSVSVTHPDGGTSVTTYYADGRVQSASGTAVADSSYDYEHHTEQGGGIITTQATGSTTEWTKTYTDLAGRTFKTEYPTTLKAPPALDKATINFHLHTAAAGSRGRAATSTDPDGVTKSFTFSGEGQIFQVTETMPGGVGNRVTETLHDGLTDSTLGGSLRTITKLNGVTTSTSLQSGDGYRALQNHFGVSTLIERSVASGGDWTETTTHPDLTRTRSIYNDGRLQAVEKRDNTTADSGLGSLISSVSYTYDGLGRMLTSTDSGTGTTNYTSYTASGNLLSQTEPGSRPTTYAYDNMGRRTLVDQPDTAIEGGTAENRTRTSYYLTGTVKAVWGDQTNATFHLYDEENRNTELRTYRSLAHGTEPTFGTDGFDATTWAYHPQRGWLTAKEYPDGQDSGDVRDPGPFYTYSAAGRLKTRTWGGGKHTRYDYRQGLLVAKRHFLTAAADTGANAGNDPQTPDIGQTYNNRGQLVNVITSATTAHPGTRMLYVYHSTNFRITQEMQQVDPDITFSLGTTSTGISITLGTVPATITRYLHRKTGTYLRDTGADLRAGSLVTDTLHIGSSLAYGTTDGRLLSVTGDFVGSTGTYTYGYVDYSTSNLIDTVTGPVHTVDNQWLGDRDALDWKQNIVDTDTVSKYDYSVNAIGQRDAVAATSTVGTFATAPNWNWLYNPRGELVSSQHINTAASSRHYTFDGIGNRSEHRDGTHTTTGGTPKSYTPNALNQYNAVGTLNPVYSLDGNMTTGPLPAVPNANSALVWDGENQLIEVTPSGGSVVKYHYDALGRRVARTIGSNCTYWFYDGWNLVAEFTGALHITQNPAPTVTLEKTWLWGTDLSGSLQGAGGVGGLLAVTLKTGTYPGTYHPLYDGNGNICQYLNSDKDAVAKYEYDGFGNAFAPTGTLANAFPHRFSTKPLDAETGLYYYGYRYYDPLTGRWPSRDPIGEKGGINLYGFIGNNPANTFDILGRVSDLLRWEKIGVGSLLGGLTLGLAINQIAVELAACEELTGPGDEMFLKTRYNRVMDLALGPLIDGEVYTRVYLDENGCCKSEYVVAKGGRGGGAA